MPKGGPQRWLWDAGFGKPFEDPNPKKNTKNTSQKTCKNQSWENMKNDDKTMPKGNQKSVIFQFVSEEVTLGNCQS